MAAGFRKSLFGFNSDDVLNYITNTQKEHACEVRELNQKITTLSDTLSTMQDENATLQAERDGMAEQIQAFHDKFEEIERLAENIGKLYLVAQSSSRAIMENTTESRALAQAEIDRNLESISTTQRALKEIQNEMQSISEHFSSEMDRLNSSLGTARSNIEQKSSESEQHTNEFAAVLEMLER